MNLRWPLLAPLLLLPVIGFALALATGSDGLDVSRSVTALLSDNDPLTRNIILDLRLPRALAAFGCGALLALAGALLQALLRNPLADPFVLGISSGAGALTLLAMLLGGGAMMIAAAGLGGALLSTAILFALAWQGGLLPTRLLLAGVILSAAWSALVTLTLALAPDAPLRGMVFWLMGDLGAISPAQANWSVLGAGLCLLLAWPLGQALDALGRGELTAAALGVDVVRLRIIALLLAATSTALVVLTAGSIGFVGLVVPHLLRLGGLRQHRLLLPACLLGGGSLLLVADVAARTIAAPLQLPVGAITALMGAPLFLWLLTRTAQSR